MKSVTLYKRDSKDITRIWTISVSSDGIIKTVHGIKGGQLIESEKTIKAGKNIGRSNETTIFEQAESEAKSIVQKKKDSGYAEDLEDSTIDLLPMLAHDFKKRGKDIKFPAWVQPKLDGVRCLAKLDKNGEVQLISRKGKLFAQPFEKIKSEIRMLITGKEILDGELFTSKMLFEELVGACRREGYSPESEKVEFHVFDIINEDAQTFGNRFSALEKLLSNIDKKSRIKLVKTLSCEKLEDAMRHIQKFIAQGYEGGILRNDNGLYKSGYRSKDLQKYKEFQDDEFEIIGAREGDGKDEGSVIWVCKTKNGREFDARPRGSYEQRAEWWNSCKKFEGKMLTVRFQGYTNDGCPRFPVGLLPRDYE